MNYWLPDDVKGLVQVMGPLYGGKPCMNCGQVSRYTEDGWCDSCRGIKPDPSEVTKAVIRASLFNGRKVLENKVRRGDPEPEIQRWRQHLTWLEGML